MLDLDIEIRKLKNASINSAEQADNMRDNCVDILTKIHNLLLELDSIHGIDETLERNQIKL